MISVMILASIAISSAEVVVQDGETYVTVHDSEVTLDPDLVGPDQMISFTATVEAGDNQTLHEFRVYNHSEFTDFECMSKSGWYGPYYGENIFGSYCQWNAKLGSTIPPSGSETFKFEARSPLTDCWRTWRFEPKDQNDNWLTTYFDVAVDAQAPDTTHEIVGPKKVNNGVTWIDGKTVFELSFSDPDPHPSGVNKTYYKWYKLADCFCWDNCSYDQSGTASADDCMAASDVESACSPPNEYDEPFNISEESCHAVKYWSVDKVGNKEDYNKIYVFVDHTPPAINKAIGLPNKPDSNEIDFTNDDNPDGLYHWVTQDTNITFVCEDQGPHPSGDEEFCYKVYSDVPAWEEDVTDDYCAVALDDGWCCVPAIPEDPFIFNFQEDSKHKLEYKCQDAVQKSSGVHTQYYKVDSAAPNITKTMFGNWLGECPPTDENDICFVKYDNASGVDVNVADLGTCAIDNVTCTYEVW